MQSTVRDVLLNALENLESRQLHKFRRKLTDVEVDEQYNKIPRGRLENAEADKIVDSIRDFYGDCYGSKLTLDVLYHIDERQVQDNLRKDLAKIQKPTFAKLPSVRENVKVLSRQLVCLFLSSGNTYINLRPRFFAQHPQINEGLHLSNAVKELKLEKTTQTDVDLGKEFCKEKCTQTQDRGKEFCKEESSQTQDRGKEFCDEKSTQTQDRGKEFCKEESTQTQDRGKEFCDEKSTQTQDRVKELKSEKTTQTDVDLELSEDKSWIKCAHFKDGNLSVETPTQILPFHVVLENPSFSSFGVFCWNLLPNVIPKHIPIHGKVLLYCKTAGRKCIEYKIHLYLMPAFAPIDKDFLQEKSRNGFKKIDKPPRTQTIYIKKSYAVNGPENSHIQPNELEVECVSPLENYTDITIDAAVKMIDLCLVQENSKDKVWGCRVSKGEVEELQSESQKRAKRKDVSALDWEGKQQFMAKHRAALISRVSLVGPILDNLVDQKLLSNEEYDYIRSNRITQEQMRELYRISEGWGVLDKGKFYDALEEHNAPLIQHLMEA